MCWLSESFLSIIISGIVGIGGLIVAFFTFKTQQRNRRNFLREKIYEMQLNAFQDISESIEVIDNYLGWLKIYQDNNDKHKQKDLNEKLFHYLDAFEILSAKYEIVIPDDIYPLLSGFSNKVQKMYMDSSNLKLDYDPKKFSIETFKIIEAFRGFLGVEKLSLENHQLARGITK